MTDAARAVRGARVFVVEDEKIISREIEHTLGTLGYQVCGTSSSGEDAVLQAEELRPDLVLMDIQLRGAFDGVEAARRIRGRLDVPVVFLTSYADPATLERATGIGPYGYVLKPFEDRELHAAVIMAILRHQAFAELQNKYRQLDSVANLGLLALRTRDIQEVMNHAVELVGQTLGTDLTEIFELEPGGDTLVMRAGAGWDASLVGRARVPARRDSHAGFSLLAGGPVVVQDLRTETRFRPPALLRERGVVSAMCVLIPTAAPFGALCTHTRAPRDFSAGDVAFLQAVANVVATAIERARTEEAVRVRDEFMLVASHELRTPLAALQLQLDSIQRGLGPDTDLHEKLRRAVRHTGRLETLIERLLDVSRLQSGRLTLELGDCDLAQVVRDVVESFQAEAARSRCELRVSAPDGVVGRWDRQRLEQVVGHLLANALKYGAGAPVKLSLEVRGGAARLVVADGGIGISPEDQGRIFGRFERAVSARHYGGLGLGLYLSRRVVEEHGGRIQVESEAGRGSVFTVELPLATRPAAAAQESRP